MTAASTAAAPVATRPRRGRADHATSAAAHTLVMVINSSATAIAMNLRRSATTSARSAFVPTGAISTTKAMLDSRPSTKTVITLRRRRSARTAMWPAPGSTIEHNTPYALMSTPRERPWSVAIRTVLPLGAAAERQSSEGRTVTAMPVMCA